MCPDKKEADRNGGLDTQRDNAAKPKDEAAKAAQERLAEKVAEETELPQKGAP